MAGDADEMKKQERFSGLIGLALIIAGFIGTIFYRGFTNENTVNDFGFPGMLPSYFYVAGFSCLLFMKFYEIGEFIILIVSTASILFEIRQYVSTDILDIRDILASVAGGITAMIILKVSRAAAKNLSSV